MTPMTEGNISRKEREHLFHRKEILKTALKLFSEKGFINVSMHEIARESEFAVGTLYKFFANKEDLYRTLIIEKAEEFHSELMKALKSKGDELMKIRTCIETKIKVFLNSLDYARLYLTETMGANFSIKATLDLEIKDRYKEYLEILSGVFRSGIRKKKFKRFDPYLLAVALDSMTNAFLVEFLEDPDKHPFDADLIINIFFKEIYTGSINV
jgi:AcrR family transcriptional regulator